MSKLITSHSGYYYQAYDTADWSVLKSFGLVSTNGSALSSSKTGDKFSIAWVAGSLHYATIYNASDFSFYHEINCGSYTPTTTALSPNGTWIALGFGNYPYIQVYKLSDWSLVSAAPSGPVTVNQICFSPDSAIMGVAFNASPYFKLYNTSEWSAVSGGPTFTSAVKALAFSKDGTKLAVGLNQSPYLKVYNVSDWSAVSGTPTPGYFVTHLDFSPDGSYLAIAVSAAPPWIAVYSTATWSAVNYDTTFSLGESFKGIQFNSDGSLLALGRTGFPYLRVYNTSDWSTVAGTPTLPAAPTSILFLNESAPGTSYFTAPGRRGYGALLGSVTQASYDSLPVVRDFIARYADGTTFGVIRYSGGYLPTWTFQAPEGARVVAFSADLINGYCYLGIDHSALFLYGSIVKIELLNRTVVWQKSWGDTGSPTPCYPRKILIDDDQYVYVVGTRAYALKNTGSFCSLRKYTPDGTIEWEADHGSNLVDAAFSDDKSHIFVGGPGSVWVEPFGTTVRKYSVSNPNPPIWSRTYGASVSGVVVVSGDELAVVVGTTIRKYSSSGDELWWMNHNGDVNSIAIDSAGYLYIGGAVATTDSMNARKYSAGGSLIWSVAHGAAVANVTVDPSGHLYLSGNKNVAGDGVLCTTRVYNQDGTLAATFGATLGNSELELSAGIGDVVILMSDPEVINYSESVGVSEAYVVSPIYRYSESIGVVPAFSPTAILNVIINEGISIEDKLRYVVNALLSEGFSLSEQFTLSYRTVVYLSEAISASCGFTNSVQVTQQLAEMLLAGEAYYWVGDLQYDEAVSIANSLASALEVHFSLSESVAVANSFQYDLLVLYPEGIVQESNFALTLQTLLTYSESIAFISRLPLAEGDFQAFVMNAETTGTTRYDNFPFNSLYTHNNRTFGVTETGLYELTGATDDGAEIAASVKTGDINFGISNDKMVPRAYLTILQSGDMLLKTYSTVRGARVERQYSLVARTSDNDEEESFRRIQLARGLRGTWWGFEIQNVDGADFDLKGAQVLPVKLFLRG